METGEGRVGHNCRVSLGRRIGRKLPIQGQQRHTTRTQSQDDRISEGEKKYQKLQAENTVLAKDKKSCIFVIPFGLRAMKDCC